MKVINDVSEMKIWAQQQKSKVTQVGFVPTMGALHRGHASLIQKSVSEQPKTVVSLFLNPTQFNNPHDLEKYPRTIEKDLNLLDELKVDVAFVPESRQIYNDQFRYQISETDFSHQLCGKHRPGHFTGVLTVVMKLLNIVSPAVAYFGEKDFQQKALIEGMVAAFFVDCEIRSCPTVREESGLAMSSRNSLLSDEASTKAATIYQTIKNAESSQQAHDLLSGTGFDVEYVTDWNHRRLVAVNIDNVRLIDNVEI